MAAVPQQLRLDHRLDRHPSELVSAEQVCLVDLRWTKWLGPLSPPAEVPPASLVKPVTQIRIGQNEF